MIFSECHAMSTTLLTASIQNATSPKYTKSRNSNSSVQIQVKAKAHFEFVPRDTEKSKFLDFVDFEGVTFPVEIVILTTVCNVTPDAGEKY